METNRKQTQGNKKHGTISITVVSEKGRVVVTSEDKDVRTMLREIVDEVAKGAVPTMPTMPTLPTLPTNKRVGAASFAPRVPSQLKRRLFNDEDLESSQDEDEKSSDHDHEDEDEDEDEDDGSSGLSEISMCSGCSRCTPKEKKAKKDKDEDEDEDDDGDDGDDGDEDDDGNEELARVRRTDWCVTPPANTPVSPNWAAMDSRLRATVLQGQSSGSESPARGTNIPSFSPQHEPQTSTRGTGSGNGRERSPPQVVPQASHHPHGRPSSRPLETNNKRRKLQDDDKRSGLFDPNATKVRNLLRQTDWRRSALKRSEVSSFYAGSGGLKSIEKTTVVFFDRDGFGGDGSSTTK